MKPTDGEIQIGEGFVLVPIQSDADIEIMRTINEKTWHDYFPTILPPGQTEYMLDNLYSPEAIRKRIDGGEQWYLIKNGAVYYGHFSYSLYPDDGIIKYEKIFLDSALSGRGLFSRTLQYVEGIAREMNLSKVTMCTNIKNDRVIHLAKKFGFTIIKQEKIDIGDGYFMHDHFFEKPVEGITPDLNPTPTPAPR